MLPNPSCVSLRHAGHIFLCAVHILLETLVAIMRASPSMVMVFLGISATLML